jgi:hypothetical protein
MEEDGTGDRLQKEEESSGAYAVASRKPPKQASQFHSTFYLHLDVPPPRSTSYSTPTI